MEAARPLPPGSPPDSRVRDAARGTVACAGRRDHKMAMGRMEIEGAPGEYVSGARARWLLQARRARLTGDGRLELLCAPPGRHAGRGVGEARVQWSGYSSSGAANRSGTPWLAGYHMNGDAINHG